MRHDWIELPDVPKHLEGKECWKWIEGKSALPWIDVVPRDYSRSRDHCGGIWVCVLQRPLPPEHVLRKETA